MRLSDFVCFTGAGITTGGAESYPTVVKRIKERGWKNLRVMDICCGVGTLGLLTLGDLEPGVIRELVLSEIEDVMFKSAKATVEKNKLENVKVIQGNGLENIDKNNPFDLIISHPPHYFGKFPKLTRHDQDYQWEFHKPFFNTLQDYLVIGGEAWLVEAADGGVNKIVEGMIDKSKIEYVSWEPEPNVPAFRWLTLRRIG